MATLQRVAERSGPSAFGCIEVDGEIAALGLAAVEEGVCFLGEIATAPARRRSGLARELVTALMAWARSAGATEALLQVVAENAPARSLYEALGFVDRYAYWYHARPEAGRRAD
jgi:ribosomal protein S18 acetylase RimI-like enzyme